MKRPIAQTVHLNQLIDYVFVLVSIDYEIKQHHLFGRVNHFKPAFEKICQPPLTHYPTNATEKRCTDCGGLRPPPKVSSVECKCL